MLILAASSYFIVPSSAWAQATVVVEIEGISDELLENVRQHLGIEQYAQHPDLTAGRIRRLHDKANEEIRQALQPFSYYRPKISATLVRENEHWRAHYSIDPGPPLLVKEVNLSISGAGKDHPDLKQIIATSSITPDQPLLHPAYDKLKADLLRTADNIGFFDARFDIHELRIDYQKYQAVVNLNLDTGERYHFGDVSFVGEVALDPSLMRRFISIEPGQDYDAGKLRELHQALTGSDYFASVNIAVERDKQIDRRVPITIKIGMRGRTRYTAGLGFGTDTGPRASIGMERRYLNPQGHRLSAELKTSSIRQSVESDYIIPRKHPATDRIRLHAIYSLEDIESVESEALRMEIADEYALGKWRHRVALNYQQEDFVAGIQQGVSQLLIPSMAWSRIVSTGFPHATLGSLVQLELRGASEQLLSDASFMQSRIMGKYLQKINGGRIILRADVGTTRSDHFDDLPPSIRYFAGGDYSVRGYGYKTLGPEDSEGNVIGGRHLLEMSLEYEHALDENWSAALFVDAGNAFNDYPPDLHRGAGTGIRRKLPIGWLRLDFAQAISEPDRPWRIHLTLGPDL